VRAKFLAATTAVIFFSASPATAETVTQTLEAFGFFGRWAIDCRAPPSADNTVRTSRVSATGEPVFSESLGGTGEPNIYVILRAKTIDPNTIRVRIKLNGEYRQDLTMQRRDGRIRTTANREVETGNSIVRRGIVLSTGQATPWLTRCEQERPVREQT
jgi:hypothetical protein